VTRYGLGRAVSGPEHRVSAMGFRARRIQGQAIRCGRGDSVACVESHQVPVDLFGERRQLIRGGAVAKPSSVVQCLGFSGTLTRLTRLIIGGAG